MQQIHSTFTSRVRHLPRHPLGRFAGQPQLARQIEAALRLAPAEAYRGHAALLLSCGEPAEIRPAEQALRELCSLDAVHTLRCPIRSWNEALSGAPGAGQWLQHYVMREIHRRDPTLLAILDRGASRRDGEPVALHALIEKLREWGATSPVAALRVHVDEEVEWLVRPAFLLEDAG